MVQGVPVDVVVCKEGVSFDAGGAAANVAETPGAVDVAELGDDVLRRDREGRGLREDCCDRLFDDSIRRTLAPK